MHHSLLEIAVNPQAAMQLAPRIPPHATSPPCKGSYHCKSYVVQRNALVLMADS
jgi:hypothetical protein